MADWQSSKLQAPEKLQIPSSPKSAWEARSAALVGVGVLHVFEMPVLMFGVWDFSGAWNLELGASSFASLRKRRPSGGVSRAHKLLDQTPIPRRVCAAARSKP